ncbi:MAG TPA: hypothetical protein VM143_08610 [Acidimicrobiales bacterium]|nr:hypothetical protein [Acidimicrobiales bacterium]
MLQPWTCHCGQPNVGPAPCSACLNAAPPAIAVPPEPGPGRPAAFRLLVVLTTVLLAAGLVAAGIVSGDDPGLAGRTAPSRVHARTVEVTSDSVPAADASALEQALPGLLRFTSQARGLPFVHPVRVTMLGDADFRTRLKRDSAEEEAKDEEQLRTTQRVLEGLGLLEKGVDLKKAVESLYGDAVAGFYDTEDDDLVVRGERLTVGVRVTLVHELTHALQDQHFDIDRKDLDDRDDEAADGLLGLVEGDAVRVERLYLASLSSREQKAAEAEGMAAGASIDPGLPPVLLQIVAFPYVVGPEFATRVVAGGGQERLDAAFVTPPTTSEDLLHPDRFLAGEAPATVETPKADGRQIDEGVLGELGLLLVLNASGVSGQTAAGGWGGDRYVAWKDGDGTCVRATIVMDTPQDDRELVKALDRLARTRKGVKVSGRGPFTFTSCS